MEKTKITAEQVKLLFESNLATFKQKNGEAKAYRFSRATLDAALQEKFPESSITERTNMVTSFIRGQGMKIQKVSHGVYEYNEGYLTKYLIFDTLSEAMSKIENAKISIEDEVDTKELKKLCILAHEAETKLMNVFTELLKLAPEFEAEFNAHKDAMENAINEEN